MTEGRKIEIKQNVLLKDYTTIKLGGPARYFVEVTSEEGVLEVIDFAKKKGLPVKVIGAGSNIIFPDEGFEGVVLKNSIEKVDYEFNGDKCVVVSGGGVVLDELIQWAILNDLGGMECLSWIPGTVGASPVQNVGAYGQQVSDVIKSVRAVDLNTGEAGVFDKEDCEFGYRNSRFKRDGRYIITEVTFELKKGGKPEVRYDELAKLVSTRYANGEVTLLAVRLAIFETRVKKGMIVDFVREEFGTVGSFFVNPEIGKDRLINLRDLCQSVPFYKIDKDRYRIPAAWLIQEAGFKKGYRRKGVGISPYHTLALVNYDGSRSELMEFANEVKKAVLDRFGIELEIEPDVVHNYG